MYEHLRMNHEGRFCFHLLKDMIYGQVDSVHQVVIDIGEI